jgi:hypothetical protein
MRRVRIDNNNINNNNNNTHRKVVGMAVVKYTTFYYVRTVYLEGLKFATQ